MSTSTSQVAASAVVDSVVIKILHAHSFARTSSQALSVLSNILARYLVLVASACGQYAELAGRSRPSASDVVACLNELGTDVDELSGYCSNEGVDLSRYAASSVKRLDDLAEFKSYLLEGIPPPQTYPPLSPRPSRPPSRSSSVEYDDDDDVHVYEPVPLRSPTPEEFGYGLNFLPPLPGALEPRPASPPPVPEQVKLERPRSPLPQHIASTAGADYTTQIPYADSVLAAAPPWHLPNPPSSFLSSSSSKSQAAAAAAAARFPTPSPQQALLSAYHHILTHPVDQVAPPNPAKHKVAMSLLAQIQSNTRWDAPTTLYGNIVPCPPRVTSISPSYPVALSTLEDIRAGKEVDEKKSMLPPAPPRHVFSSERPVYLASQQGSRLPELARQVLPGSVQARTTRLTHPPVLQRGSQKLIYGPGISAPWNSSLAGGGPTGQQQQQPQKQQPQPSKGGEDSLANGRETPSFTLPDAQMFATWDYEVKRYQDPLSRRGRVVGAPFPQKRASGMTSG
ncbi:hypothetical protein BKA83DRAFT_679460 [Pisolithus microcarpus]|nr:hypothetical protein BKA83DRAFT_679460 [Pisolithus microcarpus]